MFLTLIYKYLTQDYSRADIGQIVITYTFIKTRILFYFINFYIIEHALNNN